MKTKIKLLNKDAKVPSRATDIDSGYDITFTGIKKIDGDVIFFSTGISVEPPKGHYFEIFPRSSISKHSLMLANSVAVIDEGYRGEILVPIRVLHAQMGTHNHNTSLPGGLINFFGKKISSMSDIANQILVQQPVLTQLVLKKRLDSEFEVVQELSTSERADGGFGSSDKKAV